MVPWAKKAPRGASRDSFFTTCMYIPRGGMLRGCKCRGRRGVAVMRWNPRGVTGALGGFGVLAERCGVGGLMGAGPRLG